MSSSRVNKRGSQNEAGDDVAQCLAALTRVIAYAREEAHRLDLKVLTFCLDAALMAADQETERVKSTDLADETPAGSGVGRTRSSLVH